jgi:hypothetical protein
MLSPILFLGLYYTFSYIYIYIGSEIIVIGERIDFGILTDLHVVNKP